MRRVAILALAAAVLSACVAVTVERRRPRRGPVKEVGYVDSGGGEVRYSAEGWSLIVASRRRTALKLMRVNCGPDLSPAITDEYSRMDADAPYSGEDIDASMQIGDEHYLIERYIHLAYECRAKDGSAPVVSTAAARGSPVVVVPEVAASTAAALPAASSSTLVAPEPPK